MPQPLAEAPWALTRLRPDLAWPLTKGAGVTVAVIDSGVSPDHPSLSGKVLPGLDLVPQSIAPDSAGQCDENGHGTLIAGIIAGRETISAGFRFYGVAPEASVVPVRVLRDERRSFDESLSARIATAVRWAVDTGRAGVINLSLTTSPTPDLEAAIRYALDHRVVVVAASGNDGDAKPGEPSYPAAYDGVLAVASVDAQGRHVDSSTVGSYVDIAAPGVRIAGPAAAGGGYLFSEEGGTSFATAYVSGVAALIRSYEPDLTPAQVADRLTRTAEHPAEHWNQQVGFGLVDPARAVGSLGLAAGGRPVPPDGLGRPAAARSDRGLAVAATWIGVVGGTVVVLLLVALPVVRLGRKRGWRSARL